MYAMTELNCPHCEKAVNRSSEIIGQTRPPKTNDICICAYCANISLIDDDLNLRKLSQQEEEVLLNDPAVSEIRKFVLDFINHKG